jgi:hypothetical protein
VKKQITVIHYEKALLNHNSKGTYVVAVTSQWKEGNGGGDGAQGFPHST